MLINLLKLSVTLQMNKGDIENVLRLLIITHELSEEYLIKIILEEIMDIEKQKWDIKNSRIKYGETFQLNLVSKNAKNCDIYFEICEPCIVDIQLGRGAEYLFRYRHIDFSDTYKLRDSIKDILDNQILENLTLCNGKISKVDYTVTHTFSKTESIKHNYSVILGGCFFWNKKTKTSRIYQSWRQIDS
jgi:hypothetical protein